MKAQFETLDGLTCNGEINCLVFVGMIYMRHCRTGPGHVTMDSKSLIHPPDPTFTIRRYEVYEIDRMPSGEINLVYLIEIPEQK